MAACTNVWKWCISTVYVVTLVVHVKFLNTAIWHFLMPVRCLPPVQHEACSEWAWSYEQCKLVLNKNRYWSTGILLTFGLFHWWFLTLFIPLVAWWRSGFGFKSRGRLRFRFEPRRWLWLRLEPWWWLWLGFGLWWWQNRGRYSKTISIFLRGGGLCRSFWRLQKYRFYLDL